jgi:hypothetical protein
MNPQLIANLVLYKSLLIIFLIVLIIIQASQPVNVLAFSDAKIIPISIDVPRPPYSEGVVVGVVASNIISNYNSNPEASLSLKIQTLIDKLSENKLASNDKINPITKVDPEIRSLLEAHSAGKPNLDIVKHPHGEYHFPRARL